MKQKSYAKSKKVKKMPKNLKKFSLKIYKGAGMLKKTKNFLNKGTKHLKNHMEGLNPKKFGISFIWQTPIFEDFFFSIEKLPI